MTAEYPVPAHVIAAADQELAAINHELDVLITIWAANRLIFDSLNLDSTARLVAFMSKHVRPRLNTSGAYVALTIAIERLSKKGT